MKKRFGRSSWHTAVSLPPDRDVPPTVSDRISAYILVFLPWLVIYEAVIVLGPMPDASDTYFAFERSLPVIEWTEIIYALTYLFVIAARAFIPTGNIGYLLLAERSLDGPAGAFPAFHVFWSLVSAWLFAKTLRGASLWYFSAGVISLSCISTGMHSVFDIGGAIIVFMLVLNRASIWDRTLRLTEWLANSWHEWRIRRVRIINHGFYAGIGAFIGVAAAVHLAGREHIWHVLIVSFSSLIGAGIWGQALEGSSKLSRPFGFYGGLYGGALGVLISTVLGADGWQLAGAFSVAGPFVQATGRLRCLVQGCCHGRECSRRQGIVVCHERSRVVYLADLGNRPIYPAQLYSILYNLVLGALLLRVWILSAPMPLVIGGYLLLGGTGRFIEESYRGEPQTPKPGGLAVYQWLALAGALLGAIIMTFPGKPCTLEATAIPWSIVFAGGFGIVAGFAMGVDFPESEKRFSRLA